MWRLSFPVALLLLVSTSCKHRKRPAPGRADDPIAANLISTADPRATPQLIQDFYAVEHNSWRWTRKDFSVALSPPRNAQSGARLVLRLTVPEPVIHDLQSIMLSAMVGGSNLAPRRYTKSATYTYSRDMAAGYLRGKMVPVEFTLDKALPPSAADTRELGIVALQVGLVPN